jgi:hypothetical protein
LFPDEKLTLQREDYEGNELKIDGYYYYHNDDNRTLVLFLYRNGIIISTRAYPFFDLSFVEIEMIKEYGEIGKSKTRWGLFTVVGNKIECEQWVSPTEGITVSKQSGYIENDTTFHITEQYFSYNKQVYHVNEIWHFKQFSPKPDSTNNYIK